MAAETMITHESSECSGESHHLGEKPLNPLNSLISGSSALRWCKTCTRLKNRRLNVDETKFAGLNNLLLRRLEIEHKYPLEPDICIECRKFHKIKRGPSDGSLIPSRILQAGKSPEELEEIISGSIFTFSPRAITRFPGGRERFNDIGDIFLPCCQEFRSKAIERIFGGPDYFALKSWLDLCYNEHDTCTDQETNSASGLFSIQLINVHDRRLVPYPRNSKAVCKYITLSYVWGGCGPSGFDRRVGKLPNDLPRTIEDSIKVVQELGEDYLWVDSICIDQSDDIQKEEQIALMDTIYSCAYATIVALEGTNANHGLPGVHKRLPRKPPIIAEFEEHSFMEEMTGGAYLRVNESPWSKRAWTYQEGLLSRRRLFFTDLQIYFSCAEILRTEINDRPEAIDDFQSPLRNPFLEPFVRGLSLFERINHYEEVVNDYTSRSMTHDSDSLNAISALLKLMQQSVFPDGFLCGLPLANLRGSILWHQSPTEPIPRQHIVMNNTTRRITSALPSWSWVGWKLSQKIQIFHLDKVSYGALDQPPLWIRNSRGVSIKVDPVTTEVKSNMLVHTWETDICQKMAKFYRTAMSSGIEDSITCSNSPGFSAWGLQIKGIILSLPCVVVLESPPTSSGAYYHIDPKDLENNQYNQYEAIPRPHIAFPKPYMDAKLMEDAWYNDGYVDRIAAVNGTSRMNDFLLVNFWLSYGAKGGLSLGLLHLYTVDGVASRGGTVWIYIQEPVLEDFFSFCRARYARFWII
jgi:hypothetical protein